MKRYLLLGLSLLALNGCIVVDERDDYFGVSAEWLIYGQPADGSLCEDIGIDEVEINFYDFGGNFVDSVSSPCRYGYIETGRFLYYDNYDVEWRAYNRGFLVTTSRLYQLDDPYPERNVVLQTMDFGN